MLNLKDLQTQMDLLRKKREELHYTGAEDLRVINQMSSIRREVTTELTKVRAKLEVCPLSMISGLKKRENELVEWQWKNR